MLLHRAIPTDPGPAAVVGAICLGIPGWIVAHLILTERYERLPPDGFRGMSFVGELFLVVAGVALLGAIAGVAYGIARTRDPILRDGQVMRAIGFWAVVLLAVLYIPAMIAAIMLGTAAWGLAGLAGIALPVMAVPWAVGLGRG